MAPIISARGLAKRFGVAPLFRNISFTVSEGERIGIIGPNGSGKSTLLAILQGSVMPDSGDVGKPISIEIGDDEAIGDAGNRDGSGRLEGAVSLAAQNFNCSGGGVGGYDIGFAILIEVADSNIA